MDSLYAGIDLHSNNCHLAVLDQDDKRIFHKKIPNMPDVMLAELDPFKEELSKVVVESTFNWYWLVDCLMEQDYNVLLANPAAMQQYKGLKFIDDKHDVFWLAHMARLNILPQGYIYPKEDRPYRDLLRKRGHLVRLRTSVINSLQGIINRNCGHSLNSNKIKQRTENHVKPLLAVQEDLALSGEVSKEVIDFLGEQILRIETQILGKVKLRKPFQCLQSMPGVGKVLSLTIMLETGPITRFKKVGNYTSYCRKVPTSWTSNNKTKGKGNRKNGNKHLAWAFSEAAEYSRRYSDQARAFFNRKAARTNKSVAYSALAHKLARAAFYMMRDQVDFNPNKLFT
jgi:transposase